MNEFLNERGDLGDGFPGAIFPDVPCRSRCVGLRRVGVASGPPWCSGASLSTALLNVSAPLGDAFAVFRSGTSVTSVARETGLSSYRRPIAPSPPPSPVLAVRVLVAVPGFLFSLPLSLPPGTLLGAAADPAPRLLIGLAPRCACNLWLLIGLKNALLVRLGTCVLL